MEEHREGWRDEGTKERTKGWMEGRREGGYGEVGGEEGEGKNIQKLIPKS